MAKPKTQAPDALGRDAILDAEDRKLETVPVPEWGGDVTIRMMSANERDQWEQEMFNPDGSVKSDKAATLLAVRVITDGDGKRLFADEDIDILGAKSTAALNRIFVAAKRLNKLTLADVEDLEKN